jgi:hypothetical protein
MFIVGDSFTPSALPALAGRGYLHHPRQLSKSTARTQRNFQKMFLPSRSRRANLCGLLTKEFYVTHL